MTDRFDRNLRFFGEEGQRVLRETHVAIVGVGGLGTHVVQQLALLGVGKLSLVDHEELDRTNLNRYVGARHSDPIPGTPKVNIGERIVADIDPSIRVHKHPVSFLTEEGFAAVKSADYVFGCLDSEGIRLVLNEVCAASAKPYFDLASDISGRGEYGGRICAAINGEGCIVCRGLLDIVEAQRDLASPSEKRDRDNIYGVNRDVLGETGPSVVSINGVVASLAVTEFMLHETGIRNAKPLIYYYGHLGKVTVNTDPPMPDCYYCKGLYGKKESAGVEKYLKIVDEV